MCHSHSSKSKAFHKKIYFDLLSFKSWILSMYDPGRLLESTPTKSITTYTCATPEVLIPSRSTPLSSITIWIHSYFPPIHFHVDEDSLSCLANPVQPTLLVFHVKQLICSCPSPAQSNPFIARFAAATAATAVGLSQNSGRRSLGFQHPMKIIKLAMETHPKV